jgi:cell division protein FtsL
MSNWIIFVVFYLSMFLMAGCLLILIVKALIAVVRIEKNMRELIDVMVQTEKSRQKEQLRQ